MISIQVTAQNNATFARSLVLAMPGYALPLALSQTVYFLMQLRSTLDPTQSAFQQIALVFDSRQGSIGVIADDTTANTVTLALLAPAQAMGALNSCNSYYADLLYVAGGDVAYFGTLQFTVQQGATLGGFGPPPSYGSIASWPPLVDIAGASPATVLSIETQGLPGPIPWAQAAPWAQNTVYQSNAPASVVTDALSTWLCTTAHTSGAAFDPTKWLALVDATGIQAATTAAAASANAAEESASNLAAAVLAAAASAVTAGEEAGAALDSHVATATSASAAEGSETAAATQAGISTTQAGIATTQAGISTVQAGIATTQAGIATAAAAATEAALAAVSSGSFSSLEMAAALAALAPTQLVALATAIFAAAPAASIGAAYQAWIASLPVYSGSGDPPVSSGNYYSDGGIPLVAQ